MFPCEILFACEWQELHYIHLPKDCHRPKESHEDCPCQRTMLLQASRVSKCSQVSNTGTLPWATFGDYQTRDTPGCHKSDSSLNGERGNKFGAGPHSLWTQNTSCSTCPWLPLPMKQRSNKAIWRGHGVEMCFITIHNPLFLGAKFLFTDYLFTGSGR